MPDELSLSLRARVALEAHGFHFTHSLGQNFLLDDHAVAEIVARAGVKAGDHILEIGPGAGLLTAMSFTNVRRSLTHSSMLNTARLF